MKKFLAALLFLVPALGFAADAGTSYSGVWRAKHNPTQFFVVQEKGNQVLFIALPGVEQSGNTLRYSYMGNRANWMFYRIGDSDRRDLDQLKLEFFSDTSGVVFPVCDTCTSIGILLEKVF